MLFPGGLHDDVQHSGRELAEAHFYCGVCAEASECAARANGSLFCLLSRPSGM